MKTQEILVTISHAPHDAEAFFLSKDGEFQVGHIIQACEYSQGRLIFHGVPVYPAEKTPVASKPAAIAPTPAPAPKPAPAAPPAKPTPAPKAPSKTTGVIKPNGPDAALDLT